MPSDRARNTYDESRRYRSVVQQQGRVLLEADWNEDDQLDAELLRRETRDVVGREGTPDNGFKVTANVFTTFPAQATAKAGSGGLLPGVTITSHDIQFTGGTMYVGGVRGFLPKLKDPYDYEGQPDWLIATTPFQNPFPKNELVYLELFEQEISGVEDPAIVDPALGGPDTAQRLRIMQRVHRRFVNSGKCSDAWNEQLGDWKVQGYTLDHDNHLQSSAGLQVGFDPSKTKDDPCDPAAQPGYLGADNQMIRVAIALRADGTKCMVWSFDDASAIYHVIKYDDVEKTLKIANRPVDEEHAPKSTQVLELLRGTAQLDADGNVIAAEPFGPIVSFSTEPYDPDQKLIRLAAKVPTGYEQVMYVRVWESAETIVATPIPLGSSGVTVTLSGPLNPGDFWTFAVRPLTRSQVHPERYQHAPQPPEGIRRWVCPLAVVDWSATPPHVTDCREFFDDLVTLTRRKEACCVLVREKDLLRRSLQAIVDYWTKVEPAVTFCLASGKYRLPAPLVIEKRHGPVIIEGCGANVSIEADKPSDPAFLPGLIHVVDDADATLINLRITAPLVPMQLFGTPGAVPAQSHFAWASVGVRVIAASFCRIYDCWFFFIEPSSVASAISQVLHPTKPDVPVQEAIFTGSSFEVGFGAAVLAQGHVRWLDVRNTEFSGGSAPNSRFGIVYAPSIAIDSGGKGHASPSNEIVATIEHNGFGNLRAAVLAWFDSGYMTIRENNVFDCMHGFLLLAYRRLKYLAFLNFDDFHGGLSAKMSQVAALLSHGSAPTAPEAAFQCSCFTLLHPSIVVPTNLFLTLALPPLAKPGTIDLQPTTAALDRSALIDAIGFVPPGEKNPEQPFGQQTLQRALLTRPIDDVVNAWNDPIYLQEFVNIAFRGLVLDPMFAGTPELNSTIEMTLNSVSLDRSLIKKLPVGSALVIFGDPVFGYRVTLASSNLEASSHEFPTALLHSVRRCGVTGNLIQNDPKDSETLMPSLILAPVAEQRVSPTLFKQKAEVSAKLPDTSVPVNPGVPPGTDIIQPFPLQSFPLYAVAVTGNVFIGWPILPVRLDRQPTSLPEWLTYNTWVD